MTEDVGIARQLARILVEVSDTTIDQNIIELADHQGISRHDTAQLGWLACWTEFERRLRPLLRKGSKPVGEADAPKGDWLCGN